MKQFDMVNCSRGAPMGRPEYLNNTDAKARCFRVKLQGGGCYDDGGAYWGGPSDLYCATNGDGFRWFTRAKNRKEAIQHFNLKAETFRKYVRWIKPIA
jgi:hypothetical protein